MLYAWQAEWIWCLNQTIARALIEEKAADQNHTVSGSLSRSLSGSLVLLPPPRDRHASFTFRKAGPLKDAQYQGMWRCGKIHGQYAVLYLLSDYT